MCTRTDFGRPVARSKIQAAQPKLNNLFYVARAWSGPRTSFIYTNVMLLVFEILSVNFDAITHHIKLASLRSFIVMLRLDADWRKYSTKYGRITVQLIASQNSNESTIVLLSASAFACIYSISLALARSFLPASFEFEL